MRAVGPALRVRSIPVRGLYPASPPPSFILRGYIGGELVERLDLSILEVLCSGWDNWMGRLETRSLELLSRHTQRFGEPRLCLRRLSPRPLYAD